MEDTEIKDIHILSCASGIPWLLFNSCPAGTTPSEQCQAEKLLRKRNFNSGHFRSSVVISGHLTADLADGRAVGSWAAAIATVTSNPFRVGRVICGLNSGAIPVAFPSLAYLRPEG